MPAWRDMKPDERDLVMLAGAFLAEPNPLSINPRSKNDREWASSLVERGLLTPRHTITGAGKRWLSKRQPRPTHRAGRGEEY